MVNPPLILAQAEEEPGFWESILRAFFQWVLDYFCQILQPIIEFALDQIPQSWVDALGQHLDSISYWFGIINYWAPLDWAFGALTVFVTWRIAFMIAVIIVKIVRGA